METATKYLRTGIHWAGLIGKAGGSIPNRWADKLTYDEKKAFYEKHRSEILEINARQCQKLKTPFERPCFFWDELEATSRRRKKGKTSFYAPDGMKGVRRGEEIFSPVYETDKQMLTRLGLLDTWEK